MNNLKNKSNIKNIDPDLELNEILKIYHTNSYEMEEQVLCPKASFSRSHSRFVKEEIDHRLPYKRDIDRIIHSKSYARYIDKTQVVYLVENDHITHRNLHVQLVSSFAKGIAQILNLNTDLVEAIALGHDVGHPPFGHEGEVYLSQISEKCGNGPFSHPLQSCRLFGVIEPINCGLAVYDGFLCHDGGVGSAKLEPCYGKTWEDHFLEREKKRLDPDINLMPCSLEGCLVKFCDTISYLARDIEDAIQLGLIRREEIPQTLLGVKNGEILQKFSMDMIKMSYQKDYIAISTPIHEAMNKIRSFNFDNIYSRSRLKTESSKIKRAYLALFDYFLNDLKENKERSYLWENFLYSKTDVYLEETSPEQRVIDYLAGMTDGFFMRTLKKMIMPELIKLTP